MCTNCTESVLRGISRILHNFIGETYGERYILHNIPLKIRWLERRESVKLTMGRKV